MPRKPSSPAPSPSPAPSANGHAAAPTANAHGGLTDWMALNQLREITRNISFMRGEVRRGQLDPRRDVEDEIGAPRLGAQIDHETYHQLWERDAVGQRVVDFMPKECWAAQPLVYELKRGDQPTAWEQAWDGLPRRLRGESWYKEEMGSILFAYFQRLDILSGIGSFGVMLLGFDDVGVDAGLADPVTGVEEFGSYGAGRDAETDGRGKRTVKPELKGNAAPERPARWRLTVNAEKTRGRKLNFLRVFPERLVYVSRWETNPSSPRFGMPTAYQLTYNDPQSPQSGIGAPLATHTVHWTRVLHAADWYDQTGSSECFAPPRMRSVLNNVLGCHKIAGASPEAYWKGALNLTSWETHPQLGGDVIVDRSAFRDELEKLRNSLQSDVISTGMTAKPISPTVTDPTPHIDKQIELICIAKGWPIRIFKGSERGELASSQDERAHQGRVRGRRVGYITPGLLCPFIDRMIMAGVLPKPTEVEEEDDPEEIVGGEDGDAADEEGAAEGGEAKAVHRVPKPPAKAGGFGGKPAGKPILNAEGDVVGYRSDAGYCIEWPEEGLKTQAEKDDSMTKRTNAWAAYIAGNVGQVIPPLEYATKFDSMEEDEAQAMLDAAEEAVIAEEEEAAAAAEEAGFAPAAPEGFVDPEAEKEKMELAKVQAKAGAKAGGGGPPQFGKKPNPFAGNAEDDLGLLLAGNSDRMAMRNAGTAIRNADGDELRAFLEQVRETVSRYRSNVTTNTSVELPGMADAMRDWAEAVRAGLQTVLERVEAARDEQMQAINEARPAPTVVTVPLGDLADAVRAQAAALEALAAELRARPAQPAPRIILPPPEPLPPREPPSFRISTAPNGDRIVTPIPETEETA